MGCRLRVCLPPEEDRTLFELRTAQQVPQRTKDRAEALRLNAQGWVVEKIARYLQWHPQTVRQSIHRWHTAGLGGLWDAPGRGAKARWQEADLAYLEQVLEAEPRTYNSHQLAQKLLQQRQVSLSADRIRRVLQKRG
jgi:transposase